MATTHATGTRLPTYYISHGGGPWPWLMDQMPGVWDTLHASLRALPGDIGATPTAILAVSAHWETAELTVQTAPHPPMLYDYGGFPDFTYRVQYPAPGSPQLAGRVKELLEGAGFPVAEDARRGFDHGVFAPFFVAFPDADVPIVQLSIKRSYDPAEHLAVGRALAALRDEGVLIVGSGFSYHNLRDFGPRGATPSREFDDWLTAALVKATPTERIRRLLDWQHAPSARAAHPAEDHLVPLLVAVGAAEAEPGVRTYHQDDLMGYLTASSYRFGS